MENNPTFCLFSVKGPTPLTETIQLLELGSGYKILTINTTFYDEFFVFL